MPRKQVHTQKRQVGAPKPLREPMVQQTVVEEKKKECREYKKDKHGPIPPLDIIITAGTVIIYLAMTILEFFLDFEHYSINAWHQATIFQWLVAYSFVYLVWTGKTVRRNNSDKFRKKNDLPEHSYKMNIQDLNPLKKKEDN